MPSSTAVKRILMIVSLLSALPFQAQTVTHPIHVQGPVPGSEPKQARQESCWQEAGVSKAVMEQRRGLERSTKSQVEAVCADSALTTPQKHAKIREIREHARQEMDGLISPQQREAIRSCQESRGGGQHPDGGVHHGGEGPCGEMPTSAPSPSKPQPPSTSPPADPSPNP